ncbi:MAG: ATP-binding protein [Armatimonadota bacterium]
MTGKGGVGKTTVCALLARSYADAGNRVLAVDADPNTTLASCLGFPSPETIPSLTEMSDLIEERTGVKPGTPGAVFQMNPRVDDIVERFSVMHNGISLLRMGMVKSGGAGCYCPENAFLKNLISHLFVGEQDVLIMDMEAGVEHLGRGTVRNVDWLLVVVEPSRQSMDTARRIQTLAADINLTRVGVVCNKCRNEDEKEYVARNLAPLPLLGVLPYDESLRRSEQEGRPPEASLPGVDTAINNIIVSLG